MTLYLDDDIAWPLLAKLLRQAGHDVQLPGDIGMTGSEDPVHLTLAIQDGRVLMTKNHDDFLILHRLLMAAQGNHPGILVVRQENNPARDMTPKGIVAAIRKLEAAAVPVANEYVVLNHWR
jgi:predicted nuclease of predicted toxin-antitoxin system